jgi:large subunit ribosomal protein L3
VKNIIGRKAGMTTVFTAEGRAVPATVVVAGPCTVIQRKTVDSDGYDAAVLGFGDVKASRVTKAMKGRFKGAGVDAKRHIREFRAGIDGVEVGQSITVEAFQAGDYVDVVGTSKGHGFTGGIKRWNFSGGGASHGQMIHRQPGSAGDTNAGHVVKGSHRPGHYGVDRVTHQNLEVIKADAERNVLLLRGPVPGGRNGLVLISAAIRPPKQPKVAAKVEKK